MYERVSGVEVTLQVAQVGEERSDLGGGVFVDAMQMNKGIEHQQFRTQVVDGGGQRVSIVVTVEPECRYGDEVDAEVFVVHTGNGGNALEAPSHDGGIILGCEHQHRTALIGRKAAQARERLRAARRARLATASCASAGAAGLAPFGS